MNNSLVLHSTHTTLQLKPSHSPLLPCRRNIHFRLIRIHSNAGNSIRFWWCLACQHRFISKRYVCILSSYFTAPFLFAACRLWATVVSNRNRKANADGYFRILLLLSYSFGIETTNTFIHCRSSLEYHTRFQTKMGKVYTRFQTSIAQKPNTLGWHILNSPPPRGAPLSITSQANQ